MRQVVAFTQAIRTRNTKKEYYRFNFFASLHHAEIPPLDEFIDVESEATEFHPAADAAMEKRAMELLEERRRGRR